MDFCFTLHAINQKLQLIATIVFLFNAWSDAIYIIEVPMSLLLLIACSNNVQNSKVIHACWINIQRQLGLPVKVVHTHATHCQYMQHAKD